MEINRGGEKFMVKILHTGDIHLESPFANCKEEQKARLRRAELRSSLLRMMDWAAQEGVQIFLIAGDLFEEELMSVGLYRSLLQKMGQLAPMQFFISPGNHDTYHSRSLYHLVPAPENVKIFTGGVEKVALPQWGVNVYGCGFSTRYVENSMLQDFAVAEEDKNDINIMVLHGDFLGHSSYHPVEKEDIAKSGLDYMAFGHVHAFSGFLREGSTTYAYCGTPMGRGFDELGPKGYIAGTVEKGRCSLRFVPLGGRQYRIEPLDVTGAQTMEELLQDMARLVEQEGKEHLYRILLEGKWTAAQSLDLPTLETMAQDLAFWVELKDHTQPDVDYETLAKEVSLRGLFVRQMLQKLEQAKDPREQEICRMALQIGWEHLK